MDKNIKIINMTPHDIILFNENGDEVIATFKPSGKQVRLTEIVEKTTDVSGLPCVKKRFVVDEGTLPERINGYRYIVSTIVKHYCKERDDFLVPDTGNTAIRNSSGRIIGIRRFWK